MRDVNIASCFREVRKRIGESKEQLNLTEAQWFNLLEWTISHFRKLLTSRAFRSIMDVSLLNIQNDRGLLCIVDTQNIFRLIQLNLLLLVNPDHFGIWLSSSFMILINLDGVDLTWLLQVGMELDPEQNHIIQIARGIVRESD